MTHNASIFKELDKTYIFKVTIGNEKLIAVEGKRVVSIETSSYKIYFRCLESLLSVGQMIEKNYSLVFEKIK